MKTNYQVLIEELCKIEEIKKDIMELRFWTLIQRWYFISRVVWNFDNEYSIVNIPYKWSSWYIAYNVNIDNLWEIIWNNLEERHLRMYFEFIALWIDIRWDWQIEDYQGVYIAKLDNSKPFHEQDNEVYKKILDYINKN